MINKIILYGLETRCNALKVEGKTNAKIAKALTDEGEKPITEMTISRYFASQRQKVGVTVNSHIDLKEQKAKQQLNVNDELFDLLAGIKETIAEAKTNGGAPERRAVLFMAALKNIELLARRLEGLNEPPQNVFINVQRAPL